MHESVIIATIRDRFPAARAIYVFGSVGRGEAHADSDIDIAIAGQIDPQKMPDCRFALELALSLDVDLVHLDSVSTILQKEIVSGGRVLWSASQTETEMFALFVVSSYQKLNSERASILEAGKASGRYYQP